MTEDNPEASRAGTTQALWALFAGNFIIGTGILLPAGMLNDLSAGLGVSPATAGLLMVAGGVVIGLGRRSSPHSPAASTAAFCSWARSSIMRWATRFRHLRLNSGASSSSAR